ncbi:MAG: SDR family NAD(P)-dependent oxidoreductase [Cycloclasticus pugetii]|jgi:3(or 17)beta-hydroxysteroid dehydrogenase
MRMSGKVALITGGGSGIGEASCQRLAQEGATVIVTDINLDSAERVADAINNEGGQACPKYHDVTKEKAWVALIDEVIDQFAGLDVLVNNAAIAPTGSVEDTSLDDWRSVQQVNVEGVFMGTREAVKAMKEKGGSIINISSDLGIIGEPTMAAYSTSKGAIRVFTKAAALHCAREGYAIRINSVHPGFIDTPAVTSTVAEMSEDMAKAFRERILAGIPMGRMGRPLDVANGILFLSSDESSYMTGSELVIDGGFIA